tara:strand:- start:12 stop:308 length:297 start_codon:yes stop_codon:yes gene_type:complete
MKKYTITDQEWESVLNKVQTLEKENQRLTGVIEGMEKAFSLYGVVKSLKDKEALTFEEWKEQNKITISKCGNKLADNEGYVFEEWELIDKYNYEVMSL